MGGVQVGLGTLGYYGNLGTPIEAVDDYQNENATYSSTTATIVETESIQGTMLALYRSMLNAADTAGPPLIEYETNSGAAFFASPALGNIESSTTQGHFQDFNFRSRAHASPLTFSQEIQSPSTDAFVKHAAIAAFRIDHWTDGIDYFYEEGGTVTVNTVDATDFTIQASTFNIQETGDHLVFWCFEFDANTTGITGTLRFSVDVGGTDPYNVGSIGFNDLITGLAGATTWQRNWGGFFIVNLGSTGNTVFTMTGNATGGLQNTNGRTRRGKFFVIPASKFTRVASDTVSGKETTNSTTYQDTGAEVTINSHGRPVLLIFSTPSQEDANVQTVTRFFRVNAGASISDGEGAGMGALDPSDIGSGNATLPLLNFVLLPEGLNEIVKVQFARNLGTTEDVAINVQDDGAGNATGFFAAIELSH